jgi:hypothetical protein
MTTCQGSVIQTTELQTGLDNKHVYVSVIEMFCFGDDNVEVRTKGMSTLRL